MPQRTPWQAIGSPGMVEYSVCATIPDEDTIREYVSWLVSGHVQAVLAAGAVSATVSRPDPPSPVSVRVTYRFADRTCLDRYLAEHAPRLRAEGACRFPASAGLRFERSTGVVCGEFVPGPGRSRGSGLA